MRAAAYIFIFLSWLVPVCASAQAEQDKVDSLNVTDAQGRKQGVWRTYYFDNKLKEETTYKDGKKNGLSLLFYHYPNCLKTEITYKNDSIHGYRMEYFRNCNLKRSETYEDGIRNGYVYEYDRNGTLVAEGLYKKGELLPTEKIARDEKDKDKRKDEPAELPIERPLRSKKKDLAPFAEGNVVITDSVVIKSLDRINLTSNTAVVTDVTGSMYPYVGQLLVWYHQRVSTTPLQQFVFFNDGNNKPDYHKKVGYVGGFYYDDSQDLEILKKTMEDAMNNGDGGAPDENDIEALIAAQRKYPAVDKLVLIADRWSPVSDMILLDRIKVPVHIILCGRNEYLNPQYLDVAYKTGGKLYSLDEEVKEISNVAEGTRIKIAHLTFQFKKGRFTLLGY